MLGLPQDAKPVGDFGEISDIERAEFTAPERAGKAEAEQRAVALADHVVGTERDQRQCHMACQPSTMKQPCDRPVSSSVAPAPGPVTAMRFGHLPPVPQFRPSRGAAWKQRGLTLHNFRLFNATLMRYSHLA
jgi:hypothetical protein